MRGVLRVEGFEVAYTGALPFRDRREAVAGAVGVRAPFVVAAASAALRFDEGEAFECGVVHDVAAFVAEAADERFTTLLLGRFVDEGLDAAGGAARVADLRLVLPGGELAFRSFDCAGETHCVGRTGGGGDP